MTSSIRKIAETKGSKTFSKSRFEKCLKQLYIEYITKKKPSKRAKIIGGSDFPIPISEMLNISSLKFAPYEHQDVHRISDVPFSNFHY